MYNYKRLIYGIDVNKLKQNHEFHDLGFIISEGCTEVYVKDEDGGFYLEITTDYNGSCSSSYIPGYIGFSITDNDNNPNYVNEIINFDHDKYKALYEQAKPQLIEGLRDFADGFSPNDSQADFKETNEDIETAKDINLLIEILQSAEPTLHEIDVTS